MSRNWYQGFGGYVDAQGHALSLSQVNDIFRACRPPDLSSKVQITQCVRDHGVFQHYIFQPADRFWMFQSIEAAIFLALTLALIAFTVWWVKHRPA